MNKHDRVYVAGHRGLVGSALVRRLESEGFGDLVLRTRAELDLTDRDATFRFFERERPRYVFRPKGPHGAQKKGRSSAA